jgi:hypothetical protein
MQWLDNSIVADQGCFSPIRIFSIPDPTTKTTTKGGEGKISCITFFVALYFTKFLFFKKHRKKYDPLTKN